MTRVLYIATAYPRSEADVITPWLVETIKLLRERGIDVTMFTSAYKGLGSQTVFGTPVVRFRYFPKRWEDLTHDETAVDRVKKGLRYKLAALCYLVCGTLAAWRLCRRERFDLIHVHWPLPHYLFGRAARLARRAPVVISFHGAELMAVKHGMKALRPFLRWAIAGANAITANSSHTVRATQDICNRPVSIVPYGTTAGEYSETAGTEPNPVRQLLFCGRLVERKGVPNLIRAAAILGRDVPLHVNIVGTGPDEPALRALVSELGLGQQVTFHGFVSAAALEAFYRNCDVFVLPAVIDSKGDTEGLGVVIIDAMSHRKPVVASAVGGITDIVINEKTGLGVPPADPDTLAAALRRVLTDAPLAARLAQGGYEHIRQNYSWPAIIDRMMDVYGRLLNPAPLAPGSSESQARHPVRGLPGRPRTPGAGRPAQ
ncbi:glycosyltransferase family 4 protein [candidate division WOR-3 bacterium]|nr:glycosyltransferase family 4 protein [candidate division WOR-3 bacterium]